MFYKKSNNKKLYLFLSCILIFLFVTFTLYSKSGPVVATKPHKTTFQQKKGKDDISCHYVTEGDALPSAEDPSFSPPADSIFFHETSCRGNLNSRQACCIEAAAKTHPWRMIYVLFSAPVTADIFYFTENNNIYALRTYPNIIFARVHIEKYAKGTALEPLILKRAHNSSRWKVVHTADLLRFITLYKYGGMYLDLDVIVVKPMDDLGSNWVARESASNVNNAVVNVATDELGRSFVRKVLEEISRTYRGDVWAHNGPAALKRVLLKFCNTTKVKEFSDKTCKGFQVYNQDLIYPVTPGQYKKLLKHGNVKNDTAYCFHLWNKLSHGVEVQKDSPFDKLGYQQCPLIHWLNADSFEF